MTLEKRPHTGRRRNEDARKAILDAAFTLVRETEGTGFTIDALGAAAGVGRQTIYRWWPSKHAVIAEALAERAHGAASPRDTGDLHADLARFLDDTFAAVSEPANRRMLTTLLASAQQDPHLAAVAADFTAGRRRELRAILEQGRDRGQLPSTAPLDTLTDLAYGFLWYRLLLGHAPLDTAAAAELTGALLAAAAPRGEC